MMVTDLFILLKQELAIALIIFLLLILKLGKERDNEFVLKLANVLLLLNVAVGFFGVRYGNLFGTMFHTTPLIVFEKNLLNLATLLVSFSSFSWLRTHKQVVEFYALLLSTLLGLFFMISSSNLLMFYVGLELSTIPLAALVNFDLGKKRSSEAAFKMIISAAFSSALLLLGISFAYGISGSLDFAAVGLKFSPAEPLHIFAFLLLFSGFAFKISAVPFHLWTADVYEGAPVAITAYLSVVSKAAVLFALMPLLFSAFSTLQETWYKLLCVLAVATLLIGNLFALRQQNIKRLLAFSSIAQVGFILVGMSGGMQQSMAAVIYFILVYVFSNLAAFGVVALVGAASGKEEVNSYKGFSKTNPALAWILAIALFSLAGVPPAAGFFGKFFLLMAGASKGNYILIVIAALNMVLSLYYYLRIVKAMFMDAGPEPVAKIYIDAWARIALYVCVAGILLTGLFGVLYQHIFSLSNFS